MAMTKLLRVNNKLNIPLTGTGPTTQATYSSISRWESSLNYPLTLPKNAKIGLLDCLIELPNDYIIVSFARDEDGVLIYPFFAVKLGENMTSKEVNLLPGKYSVEFFKNMLEWSLNGSLEYEGTEDTDYATGFNYSCPTYLVEQFSIKKQPTLKIQWNRSNPDSLIEEDKLNQINTTYDELTNTLTKDAGADLTANAYGITNQYFTKGPGIIQAGVNHLGNLDYTLKVGIMPPNKTFPNGIIDDDEFLIMCKVDLNIANDTLIYKVGQYSQGIVSSDDVNFFSPLCDYDLNVFIIDDGLFQYADIGEVEALDGDLIQIISTSNLVTPSKHLGGFYKIQIARPDGLGGFNYITLVESIPKAAFLQWNSSRLLGVKAIYNNTEYDLEDIENLKDLVGVYVLSLTGSSCTDLLFTSDPFHVVDPLNKTQIHTSDTDIDLTIPNLNAIVPCRVVFNFQYMQRNEDNINLWNTLFQFENDYFTYINNVKGQLIGLKPIYYYGLRFPINIIIDNLDIESYDTSIKDKENLLFCLSESNLVPFNPEGDVLAIKFTCQNEPLMISLRNKEIVTLNKLKLRLTDNYYNIFNLNTLRESHFNILVSSGKTFDKYDNSEKS